MRQQHHIVHGQQFRRHPRFGGVDIEPGAGDQPPAQGLRQRRLIDARTPAHIDEHTLRAERFEHFEIDQALGFRPARQHIEQNVAVPGKLPGRGEIRERNILFAPAVVIGEAQPESFGPAHNRRADSAKPEHAERAPGQAGAEGERPL